MAQIAGIGKISRQRLGRVLLHSDGVIKSSEVGELLGMPQKQACEALARWAKAGWIMRVKQGVYVPVPLTSEKGVAVLEEPWVLASECFSPCYIGGWSAAQHWNLTEQIFESVVVVTAKHVRSRDQKIGGVRFVLRKLHRRKHFGTQPVWQGETRVLVSDPSRTIVDVMNDPTLAGGIRSAGDFLSEYLRWEHANPDLLIEYGELFGNRTVFKRLGFLLQALGSNNQALMRACLSRISKGYSDLEPGVKGEVHIRRWQLRVPRYMKFSDG